MMYGQTDEFEVVQGHGAYEIVDHSALVVGRELDPDKAAEYCQRLNMKWNRLLNQIRELSQVTGREGGQ